MISHHHPDHTVNIALFPHARVHDHWAVYDGDLWTSRDADGVELSAVGPAAAHSGAHRSRTSRPWSAQRTACWRSPTPGGGRTARCTDPYAPDASVLAASRRLLRAAADTIVPGHGPAFPAAEALA